MTTEEILLGIAGWIIIIALIVITIGVLSVRRDTGDQLAAGHTRGPEHPVQDSVRDHHASAGATAERGDGVSPAVTE